MYSIYVCTYALSDAHARSVAVTARSRSHPRYARSLTRWSSNILLKSWAGGAMGSDGELWGAVAVVGSNGERWEYWLAMGHV